jgi:signal transduction histidine kinase
VSSLCALTASIAHEINQPLAGIVANASACLLKLTADQPNLEGALETARRTMRDAYRVSDVIKRLRALFCRSEPRSEAVDMNEAAQEVVALSLGEIRKRLMVLREEYADDPPIVIGDRVQLQQVILNLVLNAMDAMSDVHARQRLLVIKTERDGNGEGRVSVRDAGIGLDGEASKRLFEPFYTTKSGGMGIGLSISRSIIDGHGGRLWAAPNNGPGTTFSFSIPGKTCGG